MALYRCDFCGRKRRIEKGLEWANDWFRLHSVGGCHKKIGTGRGQKPATSGHRRLR